MDVVEVIPWVNPIAAAIIDLEMEIGWYGLGLDG